MFKAGLQSEFRQAIPPQQGLISVRSSLAAALQMLKSMGELGACENQAMWEQNSSRLSGCLGLQRSLRGAESGHAAPAWLRWSRISPAGEVANCCPPKMTALKMALMNPAEVRGAVPRWQSRHRAGEEGLRRGFC